jgi:hypothetical protein
MSEENIEIRADMALMQELFDLLRYEPKMVSIDTVVGDLGKRKLEQQK